MAYKAPGKHFREGLSTKKFFRLFPNDKAAEEWFIKRRWPEEICCPRCGSVNVQTKTKHKTMPYRCREKGCGKWFSVKIGTPMQSSKISYQDWLYTYYLFATNLKGVSSMNPDYSPRKHKMSKRARHVESDQRVTGYPQKTDGTRPG